MMINLLEQWKERAGTAGRTHEAKNEFLQKVAFIYDRLKLYFGLRFFSIKNKEERPLEKVCWLFGMLTAQNIFASTSALLDICELLDYLGRLDEISAKNL